MLAPAPVLLGEEKLTPEELADAEKQEAARAILSRRAHKASHAVDVLRELADASKDPHERRAYWAALASARRGQDLVVEAFNQVKAS